MPWLIAAIAVAAALAAILWAVTRPPEVVTVAAPAPPEPRADDAGKALAFVAEQAERLARGEALATTSGRFPRAALGALDSLARVDGRLRDMTNARVHIVATERDLERAREMYRSILPLASTGAHGRVQVAGASTPAAETGGDWWTYRELSGGRVLVAVGDATGHGVYSAMIGCAAHGAVEALSLVGEERMTPRSVLDGINAAIRIPGADRAAMTCFAALLDPRGTIRFANASHMLPLLASTDERGAIVKVSALTTGAPAGNELDDSDVYAGDIVEGSHALAPGDVVVLFTDGLTDRRDKAGRAFGHRRLQQALSRLTHAGTVDSLAALRDGVLAEVASFAGEVPADDDVTLVLCALARA